MTSEQIQLSLKITADLNDAKAGVNELNNAIKETASTSQESNNKFAQSFKSVYEAQTEAMNRSRRAMEAEQKQAQAQEAAAKAAETHKKYIEKLRGELDGLLGSIDPTIKALGKLDEQERKLRESKKAGLIDSESYNGFMGKISEQRESLSNIDKLSSGTNKLSLNTKSARRDMTSMIRQLASGNFSAAGNSLFNIGNATGKLPALFSAATLSVGAFIAIGYGMYKVMSQIIAEQERFNRSLISTGNYAGTTAGGLDAMSVRIGKINSNYSETRKIIADLASKGNLSAKSIENIGMASAYMVALTGKNADEAIASFGSMSDSVAKWALESNKQYNWLDVATYNRIEALEKQGKTEEAIALATERYSNVMEQRVNDMAKNLKGLAKGWSGFKKELSDFGEYLYRDIKLLVGYSSLEEEIAKLEEEKRVGIHSGIGYAFAWNEQSEKELQAKIAERDALLKQSQNDSKTAETTKKALTAQEELKKGWQQNTAEAEKQATEIEKIRKLYEALWADAEGRKELEQKGVTSIDGKTFSGGQYDTDIGNITDKALKQYNEQLKNKLKLQEKSTALANALYETEQGQYKNASAELKAQVIDNAKLVDAHEAEKKALKETEQAAKAAAMEIDRFIKSLESQAERQTQKTFASRQALINSQNLSGTQLTRANAANGAITASENKKLNEELQNQLNGLLLNPASIKTAQIDTWYQTVIAQLKANNNAAGIDLIDQLLPLKKAQANIEQIKQQIQAAKTNQAQNEQSIQAQVISGLITEIEGQSQLADLHKQTAAELSKSVPLLEKLSQAPGQVGKDASAALAQLQLEVAQLEKTSDSLTNAMRNGLQTGIQGALQGLADGTYNLSEAIRNLGLSVVNAMANIASQGLAELAMQGFDNLLSMASSLTASKATDTAVDGVTDAAASAAAATEMGTAITLAGTTASLELGTSINTSMLTGTTALVTGLNSAFVTGATILSTSITAAMAAGGAANAGASAAGAAFATGGYVRGPGTGTSDSISARLSNGEYVINAAAVRRVGVDYLHSINQQRVKHFASGGLVSNVRTPSAPTQDFTSQSPTTGQAGNNSAPVIQQTLVLDSAEVVSAGIGSTQGRKSLLTFINVNKQTIRQSLGVD